MKIDGPKFNNFTNLDNELVESNKKGGNSGKLVSPIGLEVKQLSTEQGKGKFGTQQVNDGSDKPANLVPSTGRQLDDLLGADLLRLPPGLQKKFSDNLPKTPTNQAQSNSGPGNSNRPRSIEDAQTNSSNFVKNQIQNSLNTRPDVTNSNRPFSAPINRPNASDLTRPNNKGKENPNAATSKDISNSINQSIDRTSKPENLFNQKDSFKDIKDPAKPENKENNKPNLKANKPADSTAITDISSQAIEEVETTLEIEVTQSLDSSEEINDSVIDNDTEINNDITARVGRGRGNGANSFTSISQNATASSQNIDILEQPLTELESVAANVVSRLANRDLAPTTPLSQLQENNSLEELGLLESTTLEGQNNFASTLKLGAGNLLSSQLELINSALDDINQLTNESLSNNTSSTQSSNSANKINLSQLIATNNVKTISVPIGQSLEQVASELGVNVFDLLKANPQLLKDPLLFAGQRVRIPNNQELTNLANNTNNANLADSLSLEQQLESAKKATALPLDQTKASSFGSLASEAAKAEFTKSNAELNTNAIAAKQDKNLSSTETERKTETSKEVVNDKAQIKHTEPLIGFGLYGNREIEFEIDDDRPQNRRKYNLPEPFDEWADHIYNAAEKYRLDASLIASVIWCESAGKNIVGKNSHGHGLMQIDDRRHKQWLKENEMGMNPATNIDFGVFLLRKNIDYFKGKTAAGIAAYDCGVDLVEESLVVGKDVDFFTTDQNYSFRILAQQDYFRRFFD